MENLIIQLLGDNWIAVLSFVVGIVLTLVFKKALTPAQKEQVNEIVVDMAELYAKVKALIISIEHNTIAQNEKLKNPVTAFTPLLDNGKEFKGQDKELVALNAISENFTAKEKSAMIKKSGSILNFIRETYLIAKPLIDIIRLIKKGK